MVSFLDIALHCEIMKVEDLKKLVSIKEAKSKEPRFSSTKIDENNNAIYAVINAKNRIEIDAGEKDPAWQKICTMANVEYFPKGPIFSVSPDGIIRIQEVPEILNK